VFTLYRAARQVEAEAYAVPTTPDGWPSSVAVSGPASTDSPVRLLSAASTVRNAVHLDPGDRLIGAHFTGGALAMVILSLAASGIFFLLIPRVWITGFRMFDDSPIAGSRPLTGFTEQVTLGDMGEILENSDLVMQIELFDGESGVALSPDRYDNALGDDPLFRGNALEVYANGRWAQNPNRQWSPAASSASGGGGMRQAIRIEPIGTPTLFGTGQVLTCLPVGRRDRIERTREARLFRQFDEADLAQPFQYDAIEMRADAPPPRPPSANYLELCLHLPNGVERVVQAARDHLLAPGAKRPETGAEAASRLASWLRDSGEYGYSLNLSIQDPNVDPLEDFLFNRKKGHCEYFASALAVMLRGVGIPSRVISGFKGGQFNPHTGRFEVRQLHAHAWVEAWVEGGWVALDPTPPDREDHVAQLQAQTSGLWSRWRESWTGLWNSGIRLSRADQEQLVYRPLQATFADVWRSMRDARGTSAGLVAFFRSLSESPERWFSWRGGVAVFALLALAAGTWRIGRKIWSALRIMRGAAAETRRSGATVDFYERFRGIIARAGLERPLAETQREFAGYVGQRLAQRLRTCGLQEVPANVADQFYRVRYGNQDLSDSERTTVAAHLDALERCVAETGPSGRPR
jgi:transglutaminase-like putative cysteine protease